IVCAVSKSDLADALTLRDPRALDVFNVIQENPCERLHSQILGNASRLFNFQHRVLRLKGPANERSEPTAAILLIANPLQMFDAIFEGFDVAKNHGSARFQSELMCDLHYLEPLVTVDFQRRDPLAYPVDKDFAATAWD